MSKLCVNIDHVATIRQARLSNEPDPLLAAREAMKSGADGITVHLREDRRHIQDGDVQALSEIPGIRLNLEMAPTPEMVEIACRIQPRMVMLVPEGRQEITTEGGLDVVSERVRVRAVIQQLAAAGLRVSLFIDADLDQVRASADLGASVCEIHTGPYAEAFDESSGSSSGLAAGRLEEVCRAGALVRELGMRFNAGHALNYENVSRLAASEGLDELHIGHSIVSRSVFTGMSNAVAEMKGLIQRAARQPE